MEKYVFFIFFRFRRPQPATSPGASTGAGGDVGAPPGAVRHPATNVFPNGTLLDLYVFVSEQEVRNGDGVRPDPDQKLSPNETIQEDFARDFILWCSLL